MTGNIPPYYKEYDILTDIRNLYVNVKTLSLEYYKVKAMKNDPLWVNLTDIFNGNVRYRDVIDDLEKKEFEKKHHVCKKRIKTFLIMSIFTMVFIFIFLRNWQNLNSKKAQ